MAGNESKNPMSTLVPNGIILGLIGGLVLLTPLTTEVARDQLAMDLIAGGILLAGGGLSLVCGLRKRGGSADRTGERPKCRPLRQRPGIR